MTNQKSDKTNSVVVLRTRRSFVGVDGNSRVAALQFLLATVTPDRPDEADLRPLNRPRRRASERYRRRRQT
jgi:hypothetical protein